MTFAKILILVVLVSVFAFTLYKLIMQIKDLKKRKQLKAQNECSETIVNNNKEV